MARERGLYKRKDSGYWWIKTTLPDGRVVCESTRLKSIEEAREYLSRLKNEAYEAKRTGVPTERTWQDAVVRYLEGYGDKRSSGNDKEHLRMLDPYLRGKRLSQINMDTLWPYIRKRQDEDSVAPGTINRAIEIVRRILNLAHQDWRWVQSVPRFRMFKKPKGRTRFLKREETDRILAELPAHLRPIAQFALATGCRRGEILAMEWQRVDLDRRVAWLDPGTTKNGEGRGMPLNNDAVLALRAVQGQDPRWCFVYEGKRMREVGEAWNRAVRRAGIADFRFHDLRHTWASWHVMSGTSLQELMELGGWKSYEMVLRYAHLAPEHLADAAQRIERPIGVVATNVAPNATFSLR